MIIPIKFSNIGYSNMQNSHNLEVFWILLCICRNFKLKLQTQWSDKAFQGAFFDRTQITVSDLWNYIRVIIFKTSQTICSDYKKLFWIFIIFTDVYYDPSQTMKVVPKCRFFEFCIQFVFFLHQMKKAITNLLNCWACRISNVVKVSLTSLKG